VNLSRSAQPCVLQEIVTEVQMTILWKTHVLLEEIRFVNGWTLIFEQSKTRSKIVTSVFPGPKPTARGTSDSFKRIDLDIVLQNTRMCILRVNIQKFNTLGPTHA
jgi:hypothetical protein